MSSSTTISLVSSETDQEVSIKDSISPPVSAVDYESKANPTPKPSPIATVSPSSSKEEDSTEEEMAYRIIKKITYNNISVNVVIDKPKNNTVDVLVVYHGTALYDDKILEAANKILDEFLQILDRTDMMIVSVAYPEENLLIGDNLPHAEAALLWVKNQASEELGVKIGKFFLGGHSQGGYIVTRLNAIYPTDGVIANAPGPLNPYSHTL